MVTETNESYSDIEITETINPDGAVSKLTRDNKIQGKHYYSVCAGCKMRFYTRL